MAQVGARDVEALTVMATMGATLEVTEAQTQALISLLLCTDQ